jgi:hypothetical protein
MPNILLWWKKKKCSSNRERTIEKKFELKTVKAASKWVPL